MLLVLFILPARASYFGSWQQTNFDLPAFSWEMNQRQNPLAKWNSTQGVRTDHWHMFGNQQVNVMAKDSGTVHMFSTDRGPTWLNALDETHNNFGGGFSYHRLLNSSSIFCSAYQWTTESNLATAQRVFGVGQFQTHTSDSVTGVAVNHTIWAPFGHHSLVLDWVQTSSPSPSRLLEYWDVNRLQLILDWEEVGLFGNISDNIRAHFNANFTQSVSLASTLPFPVLVSSMQPLHQPPVTPSESCEVDWYPSDMFLALLPVPGSTACDDIAVWGDQMALFPNNNPSNPQGWTGPPRLLNASNGLWQPAMMGIDCRLNRSSSLLFAYGYVPFNQTLEDVLAPFLTVSAADLLASSTQNWQQKIVSGSNADPIMSRELAWRSAQLLQASTYRDFFEAHVIGQGSAYLYRHGADGAPRDQALFSLAAMFLDPLLARETLTLILRLQQWPSGQLAYAFSGHGQISGAFGLHDHPSDLDIFLLWGITSYISGTGDLGFLSLVLPYYDPKTNISGTVLQHLELAVSHLVKVVGVGSNGLIRVVDGDWDDGIDVEFDASPIAMEFTRLHGESVSNTLMALAVLPATVELLNQQLSPSADVLQHFLTDLKAPALKTFTGSQFTRAWLRDGKNRSYLVGDTYLDLQTQPWGLFAGLLDSTQASKLATLVASTLNSSIGDVMRNRPRDPTSHTVWPAISQLMTVAYSALGMHSLAQQRLQQHLYATHEQLYPASWLGLLSGPDGFDLGGGTYDSPVTPMKDFASNNANGDAMFLWAYLRTLGLSVGSLSQGIVIDVANGEAWNVTTPLLAVVVDPTLLQVRGEYWGSIKGVVRLTVRDALAQNSISLDVEPHMATPFKIAFP